VSPPRKQEERHVLRQVCAGLVMLANNANKRQMSAKEKMIFAMFQDLTEYAEGKMSEERLDRSVAAMKAYRAQFIGGKVA